jgi:excisionase family DNA binding protein
MRESKERPIRAPDDLLGVDDVAERLLLSRAAIYRLIALRRLPHYRLPGGVRFKVADVDAFLESRRAEARSLKPYGSTQDQR